MPLFPRLSFPAVRLPNFSAPRAERAERLSSSSSSKDASPSAHSSLPSIHSTPTRPSGKSFEKFIEEVSPSFSHDKRFVQGLVKYKNLKNHVRKIENGKFGAKPTGEYIDEECAICLEPLGNTADVVNTTCKHRFHTFCLIESLGEGFCSSCPMCRNGVENIVPTGVEGAQMRLLAKLRINIDQAEAAHKAVAEELEKRAKVCISDLEAVNSNKAKRLAYTNPKKKKELETRAGQIKDQLQLLEEYDRVNVMGFSKICNKVSRKLSQALGETLEDKYVKEKRYFQDFEGPDSTASLRHLSQDIDRGLEQLRAPSHWKDRLWTSSTDRGGDGGGDGEAARGRGGTPRRSTSPRRATTRAQPQPQPQPRTPNAPAPHAASSPAPEIGARGALADTAEDLDAEL